jgi:GT2 family glycosyltransferase
MMQISIITPVFNAGPYVREAVESALIQPETHEVILVDDGSEDDSYEICRRLSAEHDRVKVYTHADHANRGAGASRNLAIEKASCEWVAFLDADDVFCEARFAHVHGILQDCPWADGVYDAIGVVFETRAEETQWREKNRPLLTTMTRVVPPEELFEEMAPIGDAGYWSIDGWVVRKGLLKNVGLFDEDLRLHQDTVLCMKAAAVGRLVPGKLEEPSAMRRVHDKNRITAERTAREAYDARSSMWAAMWRWSTKRLSPQRQDLVFRRWLDSTFGSWGGSGPAESEIDRLRASLGLLAEQPSIGLRAQFWKRLVLQSAVTVRAAIKRG